MWDVVQAGVISDAPSLSEVLLRIVQFLLSIAGLIAMIAIVIVAVRMLFARDVKQSTAIKKSLALIILGLLVLFGGMVLINQIGSFFQ